MTRPRLPSNPNLLWASLIIEELIRNGIDYFCLSPGSRSSPLAIAVALNPRAKSFVHFDERASAFHALGYIAARRKGSCVITTSGTATANLLPAVIEASKKKLPLMILTADRPPELRSTGANQTIDQVKIFGDYVRFFFDVPCPTADITPRFVLTTVDQAIFRSRGEHPGPVHLNCMYREPLFGNARTALRFVPIELKRWQKTRLPYTSYITPEGKLNPDTINVILRQISGIKQGVIVVGKLNSRQEQEGVLALAEKLNWPVFPDVTSGLRLGCSHKNVIHYFDSILSPHIATAGVIHLGGRMTSQRWYEYLKNIHPAVYVMVLNHPLRNDPIHGVTHRVQGRIEDFCYSLAEKLPSHHRNLALSSLQRLNQHVDTVIEAYLGGQGQLSEAALARLLTQHIPAHDGLFLASSLPIREVDICGDPKGHGVVVSANRGTSGIDGTIASACGFAIGLQRRTTLLIGDLAFLHDLNSLAMLKDAASPLVVVVLNNDGGGIFHFLPVTQFKNEFERYFGTPHGLTFSSIAKAFNLDYAQPVSAGEFVAAYRVALRRNTSTLIEIKTDRKQNVAVVKGLQGEIQKVFLHHGTTNHVTRTKGE